MNTNDQTDLLHDDESPTGEYIYQPVRRRRFTIPVDSLAAIQHDDAQRIVNNTRRNYVQH